MVKISNLKNLYAGQEQSVKKYNLLYDCLFLAYSLFLRVGKMPEVCLSMGHKGHMPLLIQIMVGICLSFLDQI